MLLLLDLSFLSEIFYLLFPVQLRLDWTKRILAFFRTYCLVAVEFIRLLLLLRRVILLNKLVGHGIIIIIRGVRSNFTPERSLTIFFAHLERWIPYRGG